MTTAKNRVLEYARAYDVKVTAPTKKSPGVMLSRGSWVDVFDDWGDAAAFFDREALRVQSGKGHTWGVRKNPVPPLRSTQGITPDMVGSMVRKRNPKLKPVAKKAAPARKTNPRHSPDTVRAAQLYKDFTGHDPEVIGKVKVNPLPRSAACIGTCDGILYTTVRDGVTEKYIHKFRAKDRPMFCVSPDGKQLLLVGGAYDFTERGIVDRSDTKNR